MIIRQLSSYVILIGGFLFSPVELVAATSLIISNQSTVSSRTTEQIAISNSNATSDDRPVPNAEISSPPTVTISHRPAWPTENLNDFIVTQRGPIVVKVFNPGPTRKITKAMFLKINLPKSFSFQSWYATSNSSWHLISTDENEITLTLDQDSILEEGEQQFRIWVKVEADAPSVVETSAILSEQLSPEEQITLSTASDSIHIVGFGNIINHGQFEVDFDDGSDTTGMVVTFDPGGKDAVSFVKLGPVGEVYGDGKLRMSFSERGVLEAPFGAWPTFNLEELSQNFRPQPNVQTRRLLVSNTSPTHASIQGSGFRAGGPLQTFFPCGAVDRGDVNKGIIQSGTAQGGLEEVDLAFTLLSNDGALPLRNYDLQPVGALADRNVLSGTCVVQNSSILVHLDKVFFSGRLVDNDLLGLQQPFTILSAAGTISPPIVMLYPLTSQALPSR